MPPDGREILGSPTPADPGRPAHVAKESRWNDFLRSFSAHRRWIFAFWVVMFVAGGSPAGRFPDRLTFDFSLPGQPGYEAEQQLIATFGASTRRHPRPGGHRAREARPSQDQAADVRAVFDAVRTAVPHRSGSSTLAAPATPRFITDDGRTTFALVQGPQPQGFGPGRAGRRQFSARARAGGRTGRPEPG